MASTRLNALAARKQLLVAQADLHRQLLSMEVTRLGNARLGPDGVVTRHRWWLVGGAVVVGTVLTRYWRGVAQWLPPALSVARTLIR